MNDIPVSFAVYEYLAFFFNDTATTEIYTLSLHDALPISRALGPALSHAVGSSPFSSRRPAQSPPGGPRPSHRVRALFRYGPSVAFPIDDLQCASRAARPHAPDPFP